MVRTYLSQLLLCVWAAIVLYNLSALVGCQSRTSAPAPASARPSANPASNPPTAKHLEPNIVAQRRPEWSQGPWPRTPHAYHAAVAVEGKIYVVGGSERSDVEVFDPKRNTWESLGKNPSVRDFPGAAALEKNIYVIGGVHRRMNLASVDVFDLALKKWQAGVPLQIARSRLAAVACGGKLYAIGGYVGGGNEALDTGAVEEYDPGTRVWVKKAGMPSARHGHAAVVVNDRILVIGGFGSFGGRLGALDTVEEYDPQTDRWTQRSARPSGGGFLGAVVVRGKVFAIGGRYSNVDVERYDPETDSWSRLERAPEGFERYGIATVGNDIYLIGGEWAPRRMWRFRPRAE